MLRRVLLIIVGSLTALTQLMACDDVAPPVDTLDASVDFRPQGAACAFDTQCQSGRCSSDVEAGTCGQCLDVRRLGEACDGELLTCNRSAECRDGICRSTRKVAGESCENGPKGESYECDDELFCAGEAGELGQCTPKPQLGEACKVGFRDCYGRADCERGVCVAAALGGDGESCDERRCQSSLSCHTTDAGHTCEEPHTIGKDEPCGGDLGLDCEAGTACELTGEGDAANGYSQACLAGKRQGEECASSHCALGLACGKDPGQHPYTCQPPRTEGESCSGYPCAQDLECRQGVCAPACQ